MHKKQKKILGVFLCLAILCVGAAHFATTYAVNWALEGEARSLGMDWAHHIEYRIPELTGMRDSTGVVDQTKLPDPEEFHKLLADIVSVGHIYQLDFINSMCFCELSVGSHVPEPDNPMPQIGEHSGHDHPNPTTAAPTHPANGVKPQVLEHVFKNEGSHTVQKLPSNSGFQFPVDRQLVRQIIDNRAHPIFIRHNLGPNQPSTFAEVYHPVVYNDEIVYLLRVLVNLEGQASIYTNFFRLGTLLGLILLAVAFGYPAFSHLKSQKKQHEIDRRMHFLAHHDVLTSLHNRNDFNESVSDILWRSVEKKKSALLFLFDLNNFKEVNDYYGHQVGDKMLCEFASVLRQCVPEGGYIARLGGDEFVVVLGGLPEKDIQYQDFLTIPKSIQLRVPESRQIIEATIAGGVVQYPRDADSVSELMQAADLALYAAKPNRAGEICEYDAQMKAELYGRLEIREQFRLGLEKSQIEPYYQAIVNMKTGQVEAFEALARWNHPERGILTPVVFEKIFEDPELTVLLGRQMLAKIVVDMKRWKEGGVAFGRVGFNVLDSDLKQDDFAENILTLLSENGLTPHELAVEVTESCLFCDNKANLVAQLDRLREAGSYIALDDFGTGYSSITQLKEVPMSCVKIDKSFVDDVINNLADQSIIAALLSLSNSMGFRLILEGIETVDQRDFLQDMGFTLAQGYFYSRPLPSSQIPAFIRRQNADHDGAQLAAKAS